MRMENLLAKSRRSHSGFSGWTLTHARIFFSALKKLEKQKKKEQAMAAKKEAAAKRKADQEAAKSKKAAQVTALDDDEAEMDPSVCQPCLPFFFDYLLTTLCRNISSLATTSFRD